MAAFLSLVVALPGKAADVCFTPADNARLKFEMLQQAPPPDFDGQPDYDYYPLTGAATMQASRIAASRATRVGKYYFEWANRSTAPMFAPTGRQLMRKANRQPRLGDKARTQRSEFTSIAAANACTLAQTSAVLGMPLQRAQEFAREGGVRLARVRDAADQGATGPTANTCLILDTPLARQANGVLLDYEVSDGRSPAQTLTFLTAFAGLVHSAGKRAILLVNPLDAPSQRYTGVNASNANRISQLFDRMTILLWNRNRQGDIASSYASQMGLLRAGGAVNGGHLLVDFELADTSVADAEKVRGFILRDKLAGAMLWRHKAQQGGPCTEPVNRKIACLAFGRCD